MNLSRKQPGFENFDCYTNFLEDTDERENALYKDYHPNELLNKFFDCDDRKFFSCSPDSGRLTLEDSLNPLFSQQISPESNMLNEENRLFGNRSNFNQGRDEIFFSDKNSQLNQFNDFSSFDEFQDDLILNGFKAESSMEKDESIPDTSNQVSKDNSEKIKESENLRNYPKKENEEENKEEKRQESSSKKLYFLVRNKDQIKEDSEQIYTRKYRPDNIRKKIQVGFHRYLHEKINMKLKLAGSRKMFIRLDQQLITNLSIEKNNQILSKTFSELIEEGPKIIKDGEKSISKKKSNTNKDTLKYIQKNEKLLKKSEFEKLGNVPLYILLKEYLQSEEFQNLKEKIRMKENEFYYLRFKEASNTFLAFYKFVQ